MTSRSQEFKTPTARFSYIRDMFVRVTQKDDAGNVVLGADGKPKTYQQGTLIFDASVDRTPFDMAIKEAIEAEWGDKAVERFKAGLIRNPYLAGDGKEARNKKSGEINPGLGADKWFIRVKTYLDAPVRYRSAVIPAQYGTGEDQIKSGDYGFAVLEAYTWTNKKNGDGVSFGIRYLQKTKAGDTLGGDGGGANAEDFFEKIEDEGEAPASTKTGAGASGLFG